MASDKEQDQLIEREARHSRTFSVGDRIGKEGCGMFNGISPIPKLQQVQSELSRFVSDHLRDNSGALRAALIRQINTDDTLLARNFDTPFEALLQIIDRLLENEGRYHDFVQHVDMEWGRMMLEKPYFQEPGEAPHEDDEYTHESVREDLLALRAQIPGER